MFRTALITGASAGIGRGLAERLAARGTTVVLVARRRDLLDEIAQGIAQKGGRAVPLALDASRPEEVVPAIERAAADLDGLDLVVANAGIAGAVHGRDITWDKVGPLLQLNVMGAISTLCAAIPDMVRRGRGHLCGVSSLAGIRGLPKTAPYSSSKAAVSTFLESLYVDFHGTDIHVTDVRPGYVKTDLTANRPYKMPMLMELDEALDIIVAGLDARAPIVAFPTPLASALYATRLLPQRAYGPLARRLVRR